MKWMTGIYKPAEVSRNHGPEKALDPGDDRMF